VVPLVLLVLKVLLAPLVLLAPQELLVSPSQLQT
jgi:hypothetical protein